MGAKENRGPSQGSKTNEKFVQKIFNGEKRIAFLSVDYWIVDTQSVNGIVIGRVHY